MSSPVGRLLEEIHDRSLWQVTGIYLGASWGSLQVVDQLTQHYLLPGWMYRGAIALLLIGLPIVLITAFLHKAPRDRPEDRRWFTWRNALLGGAVAFGLLVAAGGAWFASRALGIGPAAPLIARGTLAEDARIVLADFENGSRDSLLAPALTEAIRVDLSQSGAVRLVDPEGVREALERMERPAGATLDLETAREIARREGAKAVVAGAVDQIGSAYAVRLRLVEANTGEDLATFRQTADDDGEVIDALDRVSRSLRARIGESVASVNGAPALPEVTTSSLEALERYASGVRLARVGDRPGAIGLLQEAVRLDSTFAAAYRGLAVNYGNTGQYIRAQEAAARAHAYADRLPARERLGSGAVYHGYRGARDSAAYYYERLLDLDPGNFVAVNNLGDQYEWMGRYEEARALYARADSLEPGTASGLVNLVSIARTLQRFEDSDAALARLEEVSEVDAAIQRTIAYAYSGRLDSMGAFVRELRTAREPPAVAGRKLWETWLAAVRGRMVEARLHADSAALLGDDLGNDLLARWARTSRASSALAAERPDDALGDRISSIERGGDSGPANWRYELLGQRAAALAEAGRSGDVAGLLAVADSLVAEGDFAPSGSVPHARAVLALRAGEPEESLRWLDEARRADFGLLHKRYALTRAEALEAASRREEAAAAYDSLASTYRMNWIDLADHFSLMPLAHERAGRLFLAVGDTAKALEHLAAFTELWADADADLIPRVRSAQELIDEIFRRRG